MIMKVVQLSPEQEEERRANAVALNNNPVLDEVFASMREMYVQQLETEQVGSLTATTLHASIRVLADVRSAIRNETRRRLPNSR